ncbi:insulinase family protein [bacterium]|nr:insulinase family protein [bacterium]
MIFKGKQFLLIFLCALSFSFVQKEKISVKTLSNGLRVVILPRSELDLVSLQLWLKVGSVRDGDKPGLMHLLEHMLFDGSRNHPPGAIDEAIEEMGGRISAETGQDFTYFSIEITPQFLPKAMEILSELIRYPLFDEKEMEREKRIVLAEAKGANNPFQQCAWEISRLMFTQHPYRYPIPGWEETIAKIRRDDILSAWKSFYLPSLASIIIVGKVEEENALQLVEHFFGDWENNSSPSTINPEPQLNEIRTSTLNYQPSSSQVSESGVRSYIAFGFPAPSVEDGKAVVAFDLLDQIIQDSWIFSSLKEKGLVSEIRSFFLTQRYPSVFIIYASTWGNVIEDVREEVLKSLMELKKNLSEEILSKVKQRLLFSYALNCETYADQAHILGFYESICDFSFACDYPRMVEEITLQETKEAWDKYIRPDAYCFVALIPKK